MAGDHDVASRFTLAAMLGGGLPVAFAPRDKMAMFSRAELKKRNLAVARSVAADGQNSRKPIARARATGQFRNSLTGFSG